MQFVTLQTLQSLIDLLDDGQEFTLPSLAGPRWAKLSLPDGGTSIGKEFKQKVLDGEIKGVRLINDKVSPARYKRRIRT